VFDGILDNYGDFKPNIKSFQTKRNRKMV
jgi:hypothetical protein